MRMHIAVCATVLAAVLARLLAADDVPGGADRAVVHGRLTLDGAPFDAQFLGAIVRRDGLITPCQDTLPAVAQGRYEISVLADPQASGCGAPGAEILLWTFVQDQQMFGREWVAWPGAGGTATFDGSFSASAPAGAAPPTVDFVGEVFEAHGVPLPPGTRVEAYVGGVRCGVASTRYSGDFLGYVLSVVGPDSIPGCDRDATVSFRVDGQPVTKTAVNLLGRGGTLDLTLSFTPTSPCDGLAADVGVRCLVDQSAALCPGGTLPPRIGRLRNAAVRLVGRALADRRSRARALHLAGARQALAHARRKTNSQQSLDASCRAGLRAGLAAAIAVIGEL